MHKVIKRTTAGIIFKCSKCNKIHIEFGNMNFDFTESELVEFRNYIERLDGEYWEIKNAHTLFARKIRIPLGVRSSFYFLLNSSELEQLKELISPKEISANEKLLRELTWMHCLN